jgi:hypothetical protein
MFRKFSTAKPANRKSGSMNKEKLLFCASIICCVTMLAGCARNGGEKTFEFLKAEHDILENAQVELKKCSNPKAPTPPIYRQGQIISGRERIAEIKNYRDALNAYLNAVIQNSQRAEHILNDAETKISGLDSAGVTEDAIDLTKGYERSLGDSVQVFVEFEALAKLDQTGLRQSEQPKLLAPLLAGILDAMVAKNPAVGASVILKSVSDDTKQKIERNQEAQSHFAYFQEAVAAFKHDSGDTITKRSELVTSYGAKYPKFAWNKLLPATVQTNTNKAN